VFLEISAIATTTTYHLANYHEKKFEREKYNVIQIIYLKINLVQNYTLSICFTPLFLTDVSSEILEQPQELKEQVGAIGNG
jgi:hypothetical protein